ncbi:unnamed protein product [Symbiodinium natans]|uniref:Uncharacterized protein n=1 Tax=Symbiodinium natans TaxID=878477 RepID=A0A812PU53_9DINO|nr:unnamed protein product [Symbiodinium natans]
MRFRAALLARALELGLPKRSKGKEVADMVAESMLRILDLDRSLRQRVFQSLSVYALDWGNALMQVFVASFISLQMPSDGWRWEEALALVFEKSCLTSRKPLSLFSAMHFNFEDALHGARWLYLIAARPDDIPADIGGEKAATNSDGKSAQGRAEKDSERIHRLRRVWTETPAVFKRLREEQERKVEEMLSHQNVGKDPRPDSPRSLAPTGPPIHELLYEDAKRLRSPLRLGLLAATTLRQEKMDQEVKSRMTIAVRRWREMLAQVLLIAAFAPGLRAGQIVMEAEMCIAGCASSLQDDNPPCSSQLRTVQMASGSCSLWLQEAHLRLAEDHDSLLSVAGGASASWKDRVRITMTARLKLLVKFKQVEEQWGSGLEELLQDLNPDVPRFRMEKLTAGFAPFEAPEPRLAPFEPAEAAAAAMPQHLRVSAESCPTVNFTAQSGTSRANANTGTPPRRGSGYFGTLVSGMGGMVQVAAFWLQIFWQGTGAAEGKNGQVKVCKRWVLQTLSVQDENSEIVHDDSVVSQCNPVQPTQRVKYRPLRLPKNLARNGQSLNSRQSMHEFTTQLLHVMEGGLRSARMKQSTPVVQQLKLCAGSPSLARRTARRSVVADFFNPVLRLSQAFTGGTPTFQKGVHVKTQAELDFSTDIAPVQFWHLCLVKLAMGGACSCSCETDATYYALAELKNRLEGQTKVVQPDPRIDPKVHVTFLSVEKEDGGSVSFSPLKFTLRDLTFRTSCLVEGTKTRLAGAAAVKGATASCKKAGVSEGAAKSIVDSMVSVAQKASSAADQAKEMLRLETATERTIKVDVTVDLVKELNVEEVSVSIKDFHTDVALAETILSIKTFRSFVERAISAKASEIATRRIFQ